MAVARGGLVPTAFLSHMIPMRNIQIISMATYYYNVQRDDATFYAELSGDGEGMVIIDDLSDTGNSARILRKKYPKAKFATLYVKTQGASEVDIYHREFPQNTWLGFPWSFE